MYDNYYSLGDGMDSIKPLNWENEIIWNKEEFPDADYVEVMDSLYIPREEAVDGVRTFNTKFLNIDILGLIETMQQEKEVTEKIL